MAPGAHWSTRTSLNLPTNQPVIWFLVDDAISFRPLDVKRGVALCFTRELDILSFPSGDNGMFFFEFRRHCIVRLDLKSDLRILRSDPSTLHARGRESLEHAVQSST